MSIAPITSRRVLDNIQPYLVSLIIYRKSPPILNGRIDWTTIGQACGIDAELTAELKKHLRPGLEAIIRWLGTPRAAQDAQQPRLTVRASFSSQLIKQTQRGADVDSSTRHAHHRRRKRFGAR